MDWKWMIERGGRVTFTVISAPHPYPYLYPYPALRLTHRQIQWHWKLVLYQEFFGADRIRPIILNLHYLAVKETHLAEINSGFFFFVFLSLCIPSPAVILYVWVSECVVPSPVPWIWWKRHWREHLLTAHSKVCGRRKKSDTGHFSKISKWRLCGELMHAQFPHKYLQCFFISSVAYKQMRGNFLSRW